MKVLQNKIKCDLLRILSGLFDTLLKLRSSLKFVKLILDNVLPVDAVMLNFLDMDIKINVLTFVKSDWNGVLLHDHTYYFAV